MRRWLMSEEILDIKRWGNSLGLRIPSAIAREAKLHENSRVRITVENNHVVITEIKNRDLSLEEKLAQFDPVRHGGESMAAESVGAENWP
jgi:antitoxin MazE